MGLLRLSRKRLGLAAVGAAFSAGATYAVLASAEVAHLPKPQTASAEPLEGYVAPTGPKLALSQVRAEVIAIAGDAGEQTPSNMVVASGSLSSAMEALDGPNASGPSAPTGGEGRWLASTVYVVDLHGQFALTDAPVPRGRSAPTGTVLSLVFDAHTGGLEGRVLGDSPPDLSSVGVVQPLE